MPIEATRRGFLQISGAAIGSISASGTVSQLQNTTNEVDGAALLIGAESNLPAPNGGFFDNKLTYHYLYFATDTGARYEIETGDSDWSQLDIAANTGEFDNIPLDSWSKWGLRNIVFNQGWLALNSTSGHEPGFYDVVERQDGSVTINTADLLLDTGSGDGNAGDEAEALLRYHIKKHDIWGIGDLSFNNKIWFSIYVKVRSDTSDRRDYYTMGRVHDRIVHSGFGFKVANQNLYGVTRPSDGGTLEEVELINGVGLGPRLCICEFIPGEHCQFYVDGISSMDGEITSGLPSGAFDGTPQLSLINRNTADVRRFSSIGEYRVGATV